MSRANSSMISTYVSEPPFFATGRKVAVRVRDASEHTHVLHRYAVGGQRQPFAGWFSLGNRDMMDCAAISTRLHVVVGGLAVVMLRSSRNDVPFKDAQ